MIYRPIYFLSFITLSNFRILSAAYLRSLKKLIVTGACGHQSRESTERKILARENRGEQSFRNIGIKHAGLRNTKLDVKKSFCNSGVPRPLPHAQRFLSEPTSALSTGQ
jgi:hypothetical protein